MTNPIIPWPGGKRRMLKHLLPLLSEKPHTCYVEPFVGGAAVLFARPPAKVEVINDIDGDLVRLYRVIQHHLDEFVRQFRWSLSSREMFRWAQLQNTETLTDIQRAARFFYLQKLTFGAKVQGRSFGVSTTSPARLSTLRLEQDLSDAHLRLDRVTIEHLPWHACVERYDRPDTLFLLDPPYWQTEGYSTPFPWEEYERMASLLRHLKGHAILTINDHPDIRALFGNGRSRGKGMNVDVVGINYTIGGGGNPAARRELIYRTW